MFMKAPIVPIVRREFSVAGAGGKGGWGRERLVNPQAVEGGGWLTGELERGKTCREQGYPTRKKTYPPRTLL